MDWMKDPPCPNELCDHPESEHGGPFTSACRVPGCGCGGFGEVGEGEEETEAA